MDGRAGALAPRKRTQVRRGSSGNPCTIQDLYLQECLLGIKLAAKSSSFEDLRSRLEEELPQNSPETRHLYAMRIAAWLFPNRALDSAPLLTWRAYGDEQILLDHFRVRYLEAIPILGKFVAGPISSVEPGCSLPPESVRAFVSRECAASVTETVKRLPLNSSKLGFLARFGKTYVRTNPPFNPLTVILELHRVFGPEPATIPFDEIVAHPFWRYVGVPDTTRLEEILYWGVTSGILAKFVKSDELNQVTTGNSYAELLRSHPVLKSANGRG